MPQRNNKDIYELQRSLELVKGDKDRHIILCGDFNCPNIDWSTSTVDQAAPDKAIQQALIDISVTFNLTQVNQSSTRESNLLDLAFTTNPSLIKSSISVPGISDHDIIITDSMTKPHYVKQKPKKCFQYSKANWPELQDEASKISEDIHRKYQRGENVHSFISGITYTIENEELQKLTALVQP